MPMERPGVETRSSGSGPLTQTWLNPVVHMPHVGYQGRLNGPVDNSTSACLSCHATAETPPGVMVPPNGVDPSPWFRNVPSGVAFDPNRQSLDYSLQLSVGLNNFQAAQAIAQSRHPAALRTFIEGLSDSRPPRDGGLIH
jgi:hypothetical protein